jgi:NAD+ synthetase
MGMTDTVFTVAQINPVVGDVFGNTKKILSVHQDAVARKSRLVITPELGITGYPLEDLVNHPDLLEAVSAAIDVLASATKGTGTALLVGMPLGDGEGVYNSAVVIDDGKLVHAVKKKHLPNYGVFDEKRNFRPYAGPVRPFEMDGIKIGLMICEDMWLKDVSDELARNGAEFLIAISASPFRENIFETRLRQVAEARVHETDLPLLYVNTVGGQDEIVFDGGSFLIDSRGRRIHQLPLWEEAVRDFRLADPQDSTISNEFADPLECTWRALMLGVRDYVHKSGFTDVVLGLSGGIDSALSAAIAGDALGPEHVHCVRLPSKYTSDLSNDSAEKMCATWGFHMLTLPIEEVVQAAEKTLAPTLPAGELKPLTLENMQARARGYMLMSLSNDQGWLLLSTGNKSEIAVGYTTLYGDMCGGFNPFKDVYKTMVYLLANWRNQHHSKELAGPSGEVIPEDIIVRPPSAELAPDQKDSDSLPPYPILDSILAEMVENQTPMTNIAELGFGQEMVEKVYNLLLHAEYKRRQGAPGPKTTTRAFTKDRRIPMINRFDPKQYDALLNLGGSSGMLYLKALRWKDI